MHIDTRKTAISLVPSSKALDRKRVVNILLELRFSFRGIDFILLAVYY